MSRVLKTPRMFVVPSDGCVGDYCAALPDGFSCRCFVRMLKKLNSSDRQNLASFCGSKSLASEEKLLLKSRMKHAHYVYAVKRNIGSSAVTVLCLLRNKKELYEAEELLLSDKRALKEVLGVDIGVSAEDVENVVSGVNLHMVKCGLTSRIFDYRVDVDEAKDVDESLRPLPLGALALMVASMLCIADSVCDGDANLDCMIAGSDVRMTLEAESDSTDPPIVAGSSVLGLSPAMPRALERILCAEFASRKCDMSLTCSRNGGHLIFEATSCAGDYPELEFKDSFSEKGLDSILSVVEKILR